MNKKIKRKIYLDHAAATPLDPEVKRAMEPFFSHDYGNPSSLYSLGRRAKEAIDEARETVAKILNCKSSEIIFTGSGTESNNLAIFGIARAYASSGKHIITSEIEHHAVLNPFKHLEKEGFATTFIKVDKDGLVNPEDVFKVLTPNTTFISIMYANNEIGTIQPISDIAQLISQFKKNLGRNFDEPPFFHTDACQAAGALEIDVQKLGVDLMTINGSKLYGPKGTGALFVRHSLRLEPLNFGGGQERGLRPGTENIAGIVGLAKALKLAQARRDKENKQITILRDKLIAGIMERIPRVVLNGHLSKRLPNNVNVSILDIEGEAALLYLDEYGISAATGSACDSQTLDPSHVILALGKPYEYAHSSIRFTLGRSTTKEDIDYLLSVLPKIVEILRKMSPVRTKMSPKYTRTSKEIKAAFVNTGVPRWERKIE